jgi:hypothetical protein
MTYWWFWCAALYATSIDAFSQAIEEVLADQPDFDRDFFLDLFMIAWQQAREKGRS